MRYKQICQISRFRRRYSPLFRLTQPAGIRNTFVKNLANMALFQIRPGQLTLENKYTQLRNTILKLYTDEGF